MDSQVTYADLKVSKEFTLESSSPPPLLQDVCQGPRWHQFALKLACSGIILFALVVIGLSVSVILLSQKSTVVKCDVNTNEQSRSSQEDRNATADITGPLKCPVHWEPHQEKCLFFSHISNSWNNSLTDCYSKESSLLLIQDKEELGYIQSRISTGGILYWIGLNLTLSEMKWKWINGSFLNSDVLKIDGNDDKSSCVYISKRKIFSEDCQLENKWICQKELEPRRKRLF
ncbi:PREDICTED: killer cell lectin-like receptor subfamily B member 1 [Chrysochloris asiatica]|uniref:Killer cell lectin-like receptor subfamily B member 1 n=1 Tax=Chrysochloris asiatica TaxID=185453 RepID=A0A9B0UA83_CHRAS|nr:PREDICTED: killer cell lectin-like receptor subfamily B member 1 [Chrysochloris asiatica]